MYNLHFPPSKICRREVLNLQRSANVTGESVKFGEKMYKFTDQVVNFTKRIVIFREKV